MMRVFIDGSAGTTGLRIRERLAGRNDLVVITLPEELRKDDKARREAIYSSDAAFLCLPDDAAAAAAEMAAGAGAVILDTSTAHRTAKGWAYGFPELADGFFDPRARRIAVPGCHASGFIALVYPLIEAGALSRDALLTCHSLTGYSGGGKKMISQYEDAGKDGLLDAPRQYGLSQRHKHLGEMKAVCGLENEPVFCPIVADFYSGMEVTVPLFASQLQNGFDADAVRGIYAEKYTGPVVKYAERADEDGFLSAAAFSGLDSMEISVYGNAERILLTARYDNLGKGASGAAIECMNLAAGFPLTEGLAL